MARRVYTDDEKALALAALQMYGGDVSKAARAAGVPRNTLLRWRDSAPEVVRQIVQQKTLDLAAAVGQIANRAAGFIGQAFDYLETVKDDDGQSSTGAVALKMLPDLNRVLGTMVDKSQLLTGGATSRVETRDADMSPEEALAIVRKNRELTVLDGGKRSA